MKPIQGLFDVHPSFQNSTLESFVSHGSGAPGLDIVVDKYHDMVGNISKYLFNCNTEEYFALSRISSISLILHTPVIEKLFRWITFSTTPAGSQDLTTGRHVSTFPKLF